MGFDVLDAGLAYAARGFVHHPQERHIILRVAQEAQVPQRVLVFLALEEGQTLDDLERDPVLDEGLLQGAGQCVHADQHREVAQRPAPGLDLVTDAQGDTLGLAVLVLVGHHLHRTPLGVVGGLNLRLALSVVRDQRVRRLQDGLRRTVVRAQQDGLRGRVVPLKVEDVAYVRSAEFVDALVGIAHHEQVRVVLAELPGDRVLRQIGVLILIHQQVFPPRVATGPQFLVLLQGHGRQVQQVVEIERVGLPQSLLVGGVGQCHLLRPVIGGLRLVGCGGKQQVLGLGDGGAHPVGVESRVVQPGVFQRGFGHPQAVGLVVDQETPVNARLLRVLAQELHPETVESAHLKPGAGKQRLHAGAHLPRRLVGEGDGKNLVLWNPLRQQPDKTAGDHSGFSRTRASQDQGRPVLVCDRLLLRIGQTFQERFLRGGRLEKGAGAVVRWKK